MQRFHEKYSEAGDDAEELEYRIKRVEASLEGCNGLTPEDKIQKTAENLFELTCAQERSYDALRLEMKRNRDEYIRQVSELKTQNSNAFSNLRDELKVGLDGVMKKIEDSGVDCASSMTDDKKHGGKSMLSQFISEHPVLSFNAFVFMLILVFVSGHFDDIMKMVGPGN